MYWDKGWQINRELGMMGPERGIAVARTLPPDLQLPPSLAPFDLYDIREDMHHKLPKILDAIDILDECHRLPTLKNIARIASISVRQKADAYMDAVTQIGLTERTLTQVYPYRKTARIKDGRTVWTRTDEVGRIVPTFRLSEEGQSVLFVARSKPVVVSSYRQRMDNLLQNDQ